APLSHASTSGGPMSPRAVVLDPDVPGRLAIREVAPPTPGPNEALVRVAAVSLNPGELRHQARTARPGWRPGRDLAGTVERAGARVVGVVRRDERAAVAREAGAHHVVVGDDVGAAAAHGPYDLILESVGAQALGQALALLAPGGTCVTFGSSAGGETTFSSQRFYLTAGTTLYGFYLFDELARRSASAELARLARLVADGRLRPHI